MKHYYNIDSFEHFLRENTKDFKMMPKRRLWYSIYNNLHPSKKLPSFYTGILLLITILFFDFYNINNTNYKSINCKNQFVLANPLNDSKPIKPSTKYLSPKPLLAQRQNFVLNYRKRNFKTKSVYIKNKFSETKMEENSMISNENKTNSILSTKSPINLSSLKVSISNENFLLRENQNFFLEIILLSF